MIKLSELQAGTRIRATDDWSECWKVGDEFELFVNEYGERHINCRDVENGPVHHLHDKWHGDYFELVKG